MIMIPDTETTLLRGGKMYEEGNEKSVKPGFGGDNTDGLRRQCRKQRPKRMKKEQKNRMMASQSR